MNDLPFRMGQHCVAESLAALPGIMPDVIGPCLGLDWNGGLYGQTFQAPHVVYMLRGITLRRLWRLGYGGQ